jgi:hypothetical protein
MSNGWFLAKVTSDCGGYSDVSFVNIHEKETFIVVATDKMGPQTLVFDEYGIEQRQNHHIILLRDTLAWILPIDFEQCRLMSEL